MITKEKFAENLRFAMKQKGFTTARLARKSGMTWRGVKNLECARSFPHTTTLVALAEALGCDPLSLMEG